MPFADFIRVREVSSEDNVHLAENLIKSNPGKKWKTKNPGEKSAYVILEMSESHQITGIDVGNEHSAFVEILVGKSTCAPEDFTEILITCSFMTPIESKSSNNANRVRCFNKDALVPTVAENKWSLVKIICTQPFNKHVPYGLSFIKIHVNDNGKKNLTATQKNIVPDQFINKAAHVIGKLKFREDSPDSENENNSSLFSRWKKSKNIIEEQSTAASIRTASKSPVTLISREHNEIQKPQTSSSIKADDRILDRNRDTLLFGDENYDTINKNDKKLKHLSEQIELDKERRRKEKEKELDKNKCIKKDVAKAKTSAAKSSDVVENVIKPSCSKTPINNHNISLEAPKKRRSSPPDNPVKKHKLSKKFRPFDQLLNGVVLVISGIQNPDRGDLRSKAISMGAKYKADWDNTCTHLICAFKNTPKYNQVKGKGKIITRSWIEKCYSSKKYLPWRRFALDSNELSKPESDEEIFEGSHNPENNADAPSRKSIDEHEDRNNTLALYDIDDGPKRNDKPSKFIESSSESDTDDEIKRIKLNSKVATSEPVDIYEASTDEEDFMKEKMFQCMKEKIFLK